MLQCKMHWFGTFRYLQQATVDAQKERSAQKNSKFGKKKALTLVKLTTTTSKQYTHVRQ